MKCFVLGFLYYCLKMLYLGRLWFFLCCIFKVIRLRLSVVLGLVVGEFVGEVLNRWFLRLLVIKWFMFDLFVFVIYDVMYLYLLFCGKFISVGLLKLFLSGFFMMDFLLFCLIIFCIKLWLNLYVVVVKLLIVWGFILGLYIVWCFLFFDFSLKYLINFGVMIFGRYLLYVIWFSFVIMIFLVFWKRILLFKILVVCCKVLVIWLWWCRNIMWMMVSKGFFVCLWFFVRLNDIKVKV